MPNRPDDATWLSAEEKSVIAANLSVALSPEQREIWRGLLDPRIVALGFVNFGLIFALYGLTIWLPQDKLHRGGSLHCQRARDGCLGPIKRQNWRTHLARRVSASVCGRKFCRRKHGPFGRALATCS